ncbi:unnamed protein product [Staurois parvus]|uniref:Uncharacterized protein n=1 Tax=Staurois parvus TaxID=386267 RepID=A0ABN9EQX4_9NEOB|nr:unnamed protein product [Staurois parvus]
MYINCRRGALPMWVDVPPHLLPVHAPWERMAPICVRSRSVTLAVQCHHGNTVLLVGGDEDFFFFTLIAFTPI